MYRSLHELHGDQEKVRILHSTSGSLHKAVTRLTGKYRKIQEKADLDIKLGKEYSVLNSRGLNHDIQPVVCSQAGHEEGWIG